MFAKNSRYAKLPDVVTTDAAGHAVESKALRLLPATAGDFQHTVEENDRLDQLAYRYYKQPQKWWRICDGNPDILSPQALIGQTALVTQRIPLLLADAPPPWSLLVANVQALLGVGDAQVKEEFTLVTEQQLSGDTLLAVTTEVRRAHLLVTYLRPLTTTEELVQAITLAGFVAGAPETLSRIGKAITIPPDTLK